MNTIDRCISFCSSFDPAFLSRIRGATPAQLSQLETLAGRPPGVLHRRFLERLGNDCAWLSFGAFDPSIDALIQAHENTEGAPPAGFELFAVATDEPFEDAFLVDRGLDEPAVEVHNTLIGCDYAQMSLANTRPLASSLAALICLKPLIRYRMDPMPLRALFSQSDPPEDQLVRVDEIASGLAFVLLWFSDHRTRVFVRGTTYLVARQAPEHPLLLHLASTDRPVFDRLTAELTAAFPLQHDD